jgi:hypothetical protein
MDERNNLKLHLVSGNYSLKEPDSIFHHQDIKHLDHDMFVNHYPLMANNLDSFLVLELDQHE